MIVSGTQRFNAWVSVWVNHNIKEGAHTEEYSDTISTYLGVKTKVNFTEKGPVTFKHPHIQIKGDDVRIRITGCETEITLLQW